MIKFDRVQQIRLYEQILERVAVMADDGRLEPGQRFPPERELMKQLGVSRQALREAFSVMESRGMVSTTPGGGRVYLGRPAADDASILHTLQGSALLEVIDAREAVEVKIAELASENASEASIASLRARLTDLSQNRYTFEWNYSFHLAIAELAGNSVLKNLLQILLQIRRELYARDYLSREKLRRLFDDHAALVDAIETRSPEAAGAAMREHILHTRRAFETQITEGTRNVTGSPPD